MKFNSVDEVLDFAIGEEEKAHRFYLDLAGRMKRPAMRSVFEGFAQEELGHKAKLQGVKSGKQLLPSADKVLDLKLGDHLEPIELNPNLEYQDALIVAMKAEKQAFKMYSNLAGTTSDPNLRDTFTLLAQEEAKHKLRFEVEYDELIYSEN